MAPARHDAGLDVLATGAASALAYVVHYRGSTHAIVELKLLGSPRLRLSVAIYHAIPGVFTGVNLLNIFYLQDVLGMSARATGTLMIVYACGARGHDGRRPVVQPGRHAAVVPASMALHSLGVAALAGVTAATDTLLVAAYGLMGLGGGMGANTAQTTALLDFDGRQTHQASVIWNINRQMAFSVGAAFFLMIFNSLATHLDASRACHLTFVIASLMGLLPALQLGFFNTGKRHRAGHSH